MPDELAQAKAQQTALETRLKDLVTKQSPKFQAEFNIQRASGKSVADAFEGAKQATGISPDQETNETANELLATQTLIKNQIKSLPDGSKQKNTLIKLLETANKGAGSAAGGLDAVSAEAVTLVGKVRRVTDLYRNKINETTNNAIIDVYKFGNSAVTTLTGAKLFPDAISKPISSAIGSSVNTATAIVRNPLGAPFIIANSMVSIIDKISPGFANKLDANFKSVNLKNLQEFPSKMMGSIRHLAFAADALLSVPFEIMSDLYNGLLDLMEAIADVIDSVVQAAIQFILNQIIYSILDSVLLEEILTFLQEVGELASFVGGIADLAGGFSAITNITTQVTSFADTATNALNNPLNLAASYFPQINQGLGFVDDITDKLRNPEKLIDQLLPPEVGAQMKKISQLPGLGFIGDKGYGVGDIMETLSEGVFTKVIANVDKSINKSPALNSLFNKKTEPGETDFAQEPHADGYSQGEYKNSSVHQGGADPIATTTKILPEKTSSSNGSSTGSSLITT